MNQLGNGLLILCSICSCKQEDVITSPIWLMGKVSVPVGLAAQSAWFLEGGIHPHSGYVN